VSDYLATSFPKYQKFKSQIPFFGFDMKALFKLQSAVKMWIFITIYSREDLGFLCFRLFCLFCLSVTRENYNINNNKNDNNRQQACLDQVYFARTFSVRSA